MRASQAWAWIIVAAACVWPCSTQQLVLCSNTCTFAGSGDGACDDGGPGAEWSACAFGTDCDDCGPRHAGGAPSPPLPPSYAARPRTMVNDIACLSDRKPLFESRAMKGLRPYHRRRPRLATLPPRHHPALHTCPASKSSESRRVRCQPRSYTSWWACTL
jgi:hypothetical protein